MLTVHHLEHSRSQRILWLLEELGVEYEIKRYERDKQTSLAPPDLRDVHPLGKAPLVSDGDTTIAESGAIVEYLVDKYDDGTLRPDDHTPQRLAYVYWLHYAEGTFMPLMIISLILNRIETAPMPFFIKPVGKGIVGKVRQVGQATTVRRTSSYQRVYEVVMDEISGDAEEQLTAVIDQRTNNLGSCA